MSETNPVDLMPLATKAMQSLEDSQASAGEKSAALKIAAFAVEQAAVAQQMAVLTANLMSQSRKS